MANLNLATLGQAQNAATSLSGLILAIPETLQRDNIGIQPMVPGSQVNEGLSKYYKSPQNFFFHYQGEDTIDLQSDITDHYVEDNTAIADQIALKPERIKTEGFVGELNDVAPRYLTEAKTIAEKLTLIDGYLPGLSATALRAYNIAFQGYQVGVGAMNSGVQAWTSINDSSVSTNVITGSETPEQLAELKKSTKYQNEQQRAFQLFYGYWKQKQLFTVQTPWAIFRNMVIESIKASQNGDTDQVSTFSVTFKIMRFAKLNVVQNQINPNNMQGRGSDQSSMVADLGVNTPAPASSSFSSLIGVG